MVNSMDQAEQPPRVREGVRCYASGGRGRRCIGGPSVAKEEEEPIIKPEVLIGGVYSL